MIGSGFLQKTQGVHLVNALAFERRRRQADLPAKSASIQKLCLIKSGFGFLGLGRRHH
jgi:hypothetical protein